MGVDTWRTLWRVAGVPGGHRVLEVGDGWRGEWFPAHGVMAVEGHPAGEHELARPGSLVGAWKGLREALSAFGGEFVGTSRVDLTVTYRFPTPAHGRAFFAGMAAIELPRCETTRRGSPVRSVWWTGARSRAILARVYDKGVERGHGEAFELGRLEDQRRFRHGRRPDLDAVADGEWCRDRFRARFEPVMRSVEGVRAASFAVLAQAIADEARYGYRDVREAERLAGALVLLHGGAGEAYSRRTFYRRRAELRAAGFVLADDVIEPVEVKLDEVVGAAIEAEGWS
ncbi:MAG: hypothetical protein NZM07_03655 [Elioraea sp.]|nr:hypothetical protein [Elioraea sp.]